ncbi:hypothetical protein ZIOFF_063249 [Zingiber officinale]|uniref:Pentatricopeptide repeat-containing protein n=1 Tax=Zingiber officinale TaxID=94328 RepID=A0A8J5F451_ZINOF|nr:hypothetical protein ZIOFF_063249 [Zingiber officinale]
MASSLTLSAFQIRTSPPCYNVNAAIVASQSSREAPDLRFSTPVQLQQLHARLIKSGLPLSSSFPISLTRVAAVCALSSPSDFSYARRVFLLYGDAPSETLLLNTHLNTLSSSPCPGEALALFSRLCFAGVLPDTFTLSFVLKACSRSPLSLLLGRAVHALVEKLGFRSDIFLLNTLVHMYASLGDTASARLLFNVIPAKDVVTWNIMITHHTKKGEMVVAQQLFDSMPERSVRSWTAMIAGYVQWKNPNEALRLFRDMETTGMQPNEETVVAVLAACADLGELDLGKRIHAFAMQCSLHKNNVRVCNTLIDISSRRGSAGWMYHHSSNTNSKESRLDGRKTQRMHRNTAEGRIYDKSSGDNKCTTIGAYCRDAGVGCRTTGRGGRGCDRRQRPLYSAVLRCAAGVEKRDEDEESTRFGCWPSRGLRSVPGGLSARKERDGPRSWRSGPRGGDRVVAALPDGCIIIAVIQIAKNHGSMAGKHNGCTETPLRAGSTTKAVETTNVQPSKPTVGTPESAVGLPEEAVEAVTGDNGRCTVRQQRWLHEATAVLRCAAGVEKRDEDEESTRFGCWPSRGLRSVPGGLSARKERDGPRSWRSGPQGGGERRR